MLVIQSFPVNLENKQPNIFETLVWVANLIQLKKLGYNNIKLYCRPEDRKFIEDNDLTKYFYEIDSSYLDYKRLAYERSNINTDKFYNIYKLQGCHHASLTYKNWIYIDPKVVLFKSIDLTDCDWFLWSHIANAYKFKLSDLSKPIGYHIDEYYEANNLDSCNSSIIYCKDIYEFTTYYLNSLGYMQDNPCVCYTTDVGNNGEDWVWAATADSRLLNYSIIDSGTRLTTKYFETANNQADIYGITTDGNCYAWLCYLLSKLALINNNDRKAIVLNLYNNQIKLLMSIVKEADIDAYNRFMQNEKIAALINEDIQIDTYI